MSILMYHSISEGPGPTRIPPAVFREQLAALADAAGTVVTLDDVVRWLAGEREMPPRAVVLTFDDGYRDFADAAVPALAARRWPSTVFLPAGRVGARSDWPGMPPADSLPLLDWRAIAGLTDHGVEVGSHGVTHHDLTRLPATVAEAEIADSRRALEDRLGRPVVSFAFPFGRLTPALRDAAARTYSVAVGTSMRRAERDADPFDLPRIDMTYFRDPERLRRFVERGGSPYFAVRRVLRHARQVIVGG